MRPFLKKAGHVLIQLGDLNILIQIQCGDPGLTKIQKLLLVLTVTNPLPIHFPQPKFLWLVPYLGLPRRAAWCRALKPLLFVIVMSALCSSSSRSMSSLFLLMASWRGVSPSESCNEHHGNIWLKVLVAYHLGTT